jgi:hypothetical protein
MYAFYFHQGATTAAEALLSIMMMIYGVSDDIVRHPRSLGFFGGLLHFDFFFDLDQGYLGFSSHGAEVPGWIHNENWNDIDEMWRQRNYCKLPHCLVA